MHLPFFPNFEIGPPCCLKVKFAPCKKNFLRTDSKFVGIFKGKPLPYLGRKNTGGNACRMRRRAISPYLVFFVFFKKKNGKSQHFGSPNVFPDFSPHIIVLLNLFLFLVLFSASFFGEKKKS